MPQELAAQSSHLPMPASPAGEPLPPVRKERRRDSRRSHYSSNSSIESRESSTAQHDQCPWSPASTSHVGRAAGSPASPKKRHAGSADRVLSNGSARSHSGNPPVSRFMELLRCLAEEHERVLSHTSAALIAENFSLSTSLRRAHEVISRQNLGGDLLQLPLSHTSSLSKKGSERRERAATMTDAMQHSTVVAAAAATSSSRARSPEEQRVQTSPVLPSLKEITAGSELETTTGGVPKVSESESEAAQTEPTSQAVTLDPQETKQESPQKVGSRTQSQTLLRWHRAVESVKKKGTAAAAWVDSNSCNHSSISLSSSSQVLPAQKRPPPILTMPIPQGPALAPAPPSDVPAMLPMANVGDSSVLHFAKAPQSGQQITAPMGAKDGSAATAPVDEAPLPLTSSSAENGLSCESGFSRSVSADAPAFVRSESEPSRDSTQNPKGGLKEARRESMRSRNSAQTVLESSKRTSTASSDSARIPQANAKEESHRGSESTQNVQCSGKEELPSLLTSVMRKAQKCNSVGQTRRISLAVRHFTALARETVHSSASSAVISSTESEASEPGSPKSNEISQKVRVPSRMCRRASTIGSLAQIDISSLRLGPSEATQMRRKSTANFTAPAELTRDDIHADKEIILLNHWQDLKVRSTQSSLYTSSCSNHRNSRSWLQSQHEHEEMLQFQSPRSRCSRIVNKLIVRPGSKLRISWDFVGMALILYDLVAIPMQIFEPPPNPFTEVMSKFSTVFWTVDIPFSFITGFYREGVLVERLDLIARHYARTWLAFDVVVISIDWCLTIAGEVGNALATDSVGYMRFGKTLRFLRMLRLLRLLKVHGLLSELIDRVHSEFCLIMLGIARVIVSIMLINHLIACSWYGIGTVGDSREDSWVYQNNLHNKELGYKYTTALHWSLTQFTPASMEVVPENALERVFAVSVVVFAMVTFSSLVSSITNAMTQLRNLNSEQLEQTALLRRYLCENKVSVALMGRIWGCTQQVMDKSKRRLHEKDVAIMALLPVTLKGDLQEEVYSPIMSTHPCFHQILTTCPAVIRRACQQAVHEVSSGVGQELFNAGDEGSRMFFILSGALLYTLEDKAGQPSALITPGNFVSEAALWIVWTHAGQLAATTHCELVAILQGSFFTAVSEHQQLLRYAKCFVKHFQACPEKLTDVFSDQDVLSDLARQALVEDEDADSVMNNSQDVEARFRSSGGSFTDMLMGLVPPMPLTGRRQSVNSILRKFTGAQRPSDQEAVRFGQEGSEGSLSDDDRSDGDAGEDVKTDSASSESRGSTSFLPSSSFKGHNGEGNFLEPPQKGKGVLHRMFLSPNSSFRRSSKMHQVNPASIDEDSSNLGDSSNADINSERSPEVVVDSYTANPAEAQGLKPAEGTMKPVMHNAWN